MKKLTVKESVKLVTAEQRAPSIKCVMEKANADKSQSKQLYNFPDPDHSPNWVKFSPTFARESLASIRNNLLTTGAIGACERKYLCEAIQKILRGVDANAALYLNRRKGQPNETLSQRNIQIYNRINDLIKKGDSKRRAYLKVALEAKQGSFDTPAESNVVVWKTHKKRVLTEGAVEKIYQAILKVSSSE